MHTLCLFGGGRWSRVLLTVLHQSFPQLKRIVWVTKNCYAQNATWLQSQNLLKISLVQDEQLAWEYKPEAVIVATASHTHGKYIKNALLRQIPVLSEKPFCMSVAEGAELALLCREYGTAVGVNFEFSYASYLEHFKNKISNKVINGLDMIWQDPFCETRYGEQKIGDVYTSLMFDGFQHCLSILRFLLPDAEFSLHKLSYCSDSSVFIEMNGPVKSSTIKLSRRASERKRILSVNGGEAVLDFTVEPGLMRMDGSNTVQNIWTGDRPLSAVFNSFFNAIANPKMLELWPLYIVNCLPIVQLSSQAEQLLTKSQESLLAQSEPLSIQCARTRNLLVDMFLPKLTLAGEYHRVQSLQEQIEFSEHVLKNLNRTSVSALVSDV